MARTPRSAAEKLAMRKKKSRALLLFNIIAFSVVVIGAVLLCIFVFFKVGNVTFTSDAGYDEADIRRVCGINEGDNLVLLETESREKALDFAGLRRNINCIQKSSGRCSSNTCITRPVTAFLFRLSESCNH